MNKIRRLAPACSAIMLLTIIVVQGVGASAPQGADAYHQRVREVIEQIPYSFTDARAGTTWVGEDVPVAVAAVKLLQPNKLMQRRYRDLATGRTFSLLVVHCRDVRDMVGHYPPRCYPANGWTLDTRSEQNVGLGEQQLPALDYRFTRLVDGVFEQSLLVRNFFILPTSGRGRVVGDYDALIDASRGRRRTALGAAQIQILGGEGLEDDERQRIIELIVRTIEPAIDVISGGTSQ